MEEKTAVASLAALAQPVRLRVFRALVGAGPEGMNPGALAQMLGTGSSTLSFHLKELVHAGMVTQERDGRNLIYRASLDRMSALMDYLAAHCCLGAGCEELDVTACRNC
jgi:ArsR family transcriptional regulator, arsenate/arsenite/antimonite-responsive transcriptional repressor